MFSKPDESLQSSRVLVAQTVWRNKQNKVKQVIFFAGPSVTTGRNTEFSERRLYIAIQN